MSAVQDFSEAELVKAIGGPIKWPQSPDHWPIYAAFIETRCGAVYGPDRNRAVFTMGNYGGTATAARMHEALQRLARFNALAPRHGLQQGPLGYMQWANMSPDQRPFQVPN
ncbi:hypothetical protein [Falsiphaeobacter marinintestinus]|uniref:hypothetical protein n=1 Tax=Falsiphaeobacter marinintestinus TaxID=1492905 RepID=UPI0011B46775|nr:hypothetical protein [Phaeobacter marinintestinus]